MFDHMKQLLANPTAHYEEMTMNPIREEDKHLLK